MDDTDDKIEINVTEGEKKLTTTPAKQKKNEKRARRKEKAKALKAKANSKDPAVPKYMETPERQSRTVFVGNVPVSYTKKQIIRHFEPCGRIESVRLRGFVPKNPKLSKKVAFIKGEIHPDCKSIVAYVVFKHQECVSKAIELNTSNMDGNCITVQRVGEKVFDSNKSIFVGNLPSNVKEDQLRELFSDVGIVSGVRIIRDSETGKSKGFGFVAFSSSDAVSLCVERDDFVLDQRELRIFRSGQGVTKMSKNTLNMKRRLKKKSTGGEGAKPVKDKKERKAKRELERKKGIGQILTKT